MDFWQSLPVIAAKLIVSILLVRAFITITGELYTAVRRVYRNPSSSNKSRLKIVMTHQAVLLIFVAVVYYFADHLQPEHDVSWPEIIIGCAYLIAIRRVADIDTRLKRYRKQQKQAAKAALTPPTKGP
jgi:steroid 5-alpha reductase family enzyme